MNCPTCQTPNPDGAKFCLNCGTAFSSACPNCQAELPAQAKFCFNCGHQLAADQAPSQPQNLVDSTEIRLKRFMPEDLKDKLESARQNGGMQGERRVVTTLFCDVVGSTVAAEQLVPED